MSLQTEICMVSFETELKQAVQEISRIREVWENKREPPCVVFVGPTGSGKSTVMNFLTRSPVFSPGLSKDVKGITTKLHSHGDISLLDSPGFYDHSQKEAAALPMEALTQALKTGHESTLFFFFTLRSGIVQVSELALNVQSLPIKNISQNGSVRPVGGVGGVCAGATVCAMCAGVAVCPGAAGASACALPGGLVADKSILKKRRAGQHCCRQPKARCLNRLSMEMPAVAVQMSRLSSPPSCQKEGMRSGGEAASAECVLQARKGLVEEQLGAGPLQEEATQLRALSKVLLAAGLKYAQAAPREEGFRAALGECVRSMEWEQESRQALPLAWQLGRKGLADVAKTMGCSEEATCLAEESSSGDELVDLLWMLVYDDLADQVDKALWKHLLGELALTGAPLHAPEPREDAGAPRAGGKSGALRLDLLSSLALELERLQVFKPLPPV